MDRVFFRLFWCVRCALACVIKTQSKHLNLLELLSESASFCIGPECPSSPIRRPKKKPVSSVWMTVDPPRQSNDVRKNPKRHPPLHYMWESPPTTQPLTPLQKCPCRDPATTFSLIFSLHRTCKRALMCSGLFWGRGTWLWNRGAVTVRCHAEEKNKRHARHPQTNL